MDTNYWQRQMLSRRSVLRGTAVAGFGLAGAALIGCGRGGKQTPSTPSAPGTSSVPWGPKPVASEGAPVVSDAFINLTDADRPGHDPLDTQQSGAADRDSLVYARLVSSFGDPAGAKGDVLRTASYAVEGWEYSGDGKQLTFKLRKGIKYHNIAPVNARELVASDVKYSINRYMTVDRSPFKARYTDIASIDTPDEQTVVFKLKAPSRYLISALAAEPSFITPPELEKTEGGFSDKLVGSGPFIFESFISGLAKFRKNPDFVNASEIYYNNYYFRTISDTQTRIAAIRTNQADFQGRSGTGVSKAEFEKLKGPSVGSSEAPPTGSGGLWFNMQNPKWKDLRARMAVSKAYDHQAIIDQVYQGKGTFNGPVPTGFGKWALSENELRELNAYKYDPAEAKKLWDAAGKPSTRNEYYIGPSARDPNSVPIAELVGRQLERNLGIAATYKTDDYAVFLPNGYNGKWDDICIFSYGLGGEPLDYLLLPYYPGGARNGTRTNDTRLNTMIDELRGTLDDKAAVQKSRDIGMYISNEVLSQSVHPQEDRIAIWSGKLKNLLFSGQYPYGVEFTLKTWKVN